MGIFDRMGRVISSNLNALFDSAEDDRKLIALNLDEMAESIRAGEKDIVGALASEKQLKAKVEQLKKEELTWDQRAELALKAGDEALAREALKQKRRVVGEGESAEKARLEARDLTLSMKSELDRMRGKLAELKLRKSSLIANAEKARTGVSGGAGAKAMGGAFENFHRMEEKIEGREAHGAAMAEVEAALANPATSGDLEAKFRALEASMKGQSGPGGDEIDADLEALKKRIRV